MIYKVRFKSFLSSDSMKVNTMMTSDFESAHAFSVYRKFSIWDLWKAQHKSILTHTCLSVQKWPEFLWRAYALPVKAGNARFFFKNRSKGMGRRKFISCLYKLLNRSFFNSVSFLRRNGSKNLMSSSYPLLSNHPMRMIWPKLYILFLKIFPFSGLLSVVIECPDFFGWEKRFLGMAKTVWVTLFWEKTIFAKSVCRICGFKVTLFHPRELVKKYFWLKNIRFAQKVFFRICAVIRSLFFFELRKWVFIRSSGHFFSAANGCL